MLTLTGTIKSKDTWGIIAAKVTLMAVISMLSVVIMARSALSEMCDWTTRKAIFENKQNASIKIVERHFGCGATVNSPGTYKAFKVREIAPYLIWVTTIDTNQIDKSEWTRVESIEH